MRTGPYSTVCMAIGLAAVVGVVPASLAQDSPVLDRCKPAGIGIEAEEGQTHRKPGSDTGVFVDVPLGRACVGPDFVDGEPTYVRRTKASEGVTIVEVSTTPFTPVLPGVEGMIVRAEEQPASW